MHQRQSIDKHTHIIAILPPSLYRVLINHLQTVIINMIFIKQFDINLTPIIAFKHLVCISKRRLIKSRVMAGNGLFEFVQIFVIGNGTYTKYYANTTRESHLKDKNDIKVQKSSHSFEFTSFWADLKNNPISDLCDFAKTFFLLNIHFCVFSVGIACLMWIESCLSCDLIKSPLRRKSCKKSL